MSEGEMECLLWEAVELKKVIIVRKNIWQRTGNGFLFALMVCVAIAVYVACPFVGVLLPLLPPVLLALLMWLYHALWRVELSMDRIVIKRLLRKSLTYSYSQISDLYSARSYTLREHIFLGFSDGKHIVIRSIDENAGSARKRLASRRSIRNSEK